MVTLTVAAILVGIGYRQYWQHPSQEQCEKAVSALYDDEGWRYDYHHRYPPLSESIDACLALRGLAIDCLTNDRHPRNCSGATTIPLEAIEYGDFCFSRTDNGTDAKLDDECAFNEQACDVKRASASDKAYGVALGECTRVHHLYGVVTQTGGDESWYGLTSNTEQCFRFWRSQGGNLRNVAPGCREVTEHGAGPRLVEPPRPLPSDLMAPKEIWCFRRSEPVLAECHASQEECEAERKVSTDPMGIISQCDRALHGGYYTDDKGPHLFPTLERCVLIADRVYQDGNDASQCLSVGSNHGL